MCYTTECILLVNAYFLAVLAENAKVIDADECSALSAHVPRSLPMRWAAGLAELSCQQHLSDLQLLLSKTCILPS